MSWERQGTGQPLNDSAICAAGDTALVVEFGDVIDRALSAKVLQFSDRIRAANIAGLIETVPTIRSVLVHYGPLATSGALVTEKNRFAALTREQAESIRREQAHNLRRRLSDVQPMDDVNLTALHAANLIGGVIDALSD
jgi:hypothetical protein